MLAVSAILAIIVLSIFFYSLPKGLIFAQTMVFTSLVMYEFIRIAVIRKQEGASIFYNTWLIIALLISIAMQLLVLYSPLSAWFGTAPLGVSDWGIIVLGGIIAYIATLFATQKLSETRHIASDI